MLVNVQIAPATMVTLVMTPYQITHADVYENTQEHSARNGSRFSTSKNLDCAQHFSLKSWEPEKPEKKKILRTDAFC